MPLPAVMSSLVESLLALLSDKKVLLSLGIGAAGTFAVLKLTSPQLDKNRRGTVQQYCNNHTNIVEPAELQKLRHVTSQHPWGMMESTQDVGQLLVFFMRMIKARTVVEVGSFTGVAALKMAYELPEDGKLFALDTKADYADIGKPMIEKAGLSSKVEHRIAPALESLVNLREEGYTEKVDLCFIDADKNNYPNYYKLCLDLLRPGGIIVFDNSLYKSGVINSPNSVPECFIHETNEKASVDTRVTSMILTIGDGCLILRKNDI